MTVELTYRGAFRDLRRSLIHEWDLWQHASGQCFGVDIPLDYSDALGHLRRYPVPPVGTRRRTHIRDYLALSNEDVQNMVPAGPVIRYSINEVLAAGGLRGLGRQT